jgi:hypothetical protein
LPLSIEAKQKLSPTPQVKDLRLFLPITAQPRLSLSSFRISIRLLFQRPTYLLNSSLKQPFLVLQRPPLQLTGVQLDDQLFVDHRLDFLARGNAGDFAFESIAINRQPVGNRDNLS